MQPMKPLIGQRPDTGHPLFPSAGCWLFNEGAGFTAHDTSGNGNHGTLTNMDPATDWVSDQGGALDFDGLQDFVVCPATEPAEITVRVLCKLASKTQDRRLIGQNNTAMPYLIWYDVGNDTWAYRVKSSGIGLQDNIPVLGSPEVGVWYSLVLTYRKDGLSCFYANGRLGIQSISYTGSLVSTGYDLWIGRACWVSRWHGQISDVQIWPRALTASEVRDLHMDPYVAWRPRRRKVWVPAAAAGGSFQPAWAANSTTLVAV